MRPRRFVPAISLALAAAVLCLALLPGDRQAAAQSGCLDYYLVREGDTLVSIARFYGFDYRVIARLNNLEDPDDLLAGKWLCLPAAVGAEAAAAVPHPSHAPRFTARVSRNSVVVETFNFPLKRVYAVRIADDRVPFGYIWHKLGTLRIKASGDVEVHFKLPAGLKDTPQLRVCLKNTATDVLTCVTTTNIK